MDPPTELLQRLVAAGRLTPLEARELARLDPVRLQALLAARGIAPPPSPPLAPSYDASPEPAARPNDLLLSDARSPVPAAPPPAGSDSSRLRDVEPRSLGRYQLLAELGRGGMGVVWRARDPQLRREVAVKMLIPSPETPELAARRRERFLREGRAVARLRHPNVVALHEVGEDDGRPYLVMDFVRGGSLEQTLSAERHLSPRRAAEVVRDVALALDHAHAQGIVHRDVKPGNVLLEQETGRALLSDFGLARDVTGAERNLSHSGQLIGTPDYLSPEQVRGEREIGPAADVWALGGLLYKTLTGELPFPCETLGQLMHEVLERDPLPLRALDPSLHVDLETIALKCLEKEPQRRYSSAGVVAAELSRFLQGEALVARPLGRGERAARWARRNRALSATLAVSSALVLGLLVLGAIGAVLSVQRIRRERDLAEEARARAEEEGRRASAAEAEARAAAARTAEESRARGELLARALLDRGDRFRHEGRYHEAAALYAASLSHGESTGARSGLVAALSHAPRALRTSSPLVATTLLLTPDGRALTAGTGGLLRAERLGASSDDRWARQGEVDVLCGALQPGGELAALGDGTGLVRQVRLSDGIEVARWPAGEEERGVAAVAWSQRGDELVAARRGALELPRWTRDGRPLAPIPVPAAVLALSFTPDGGTLLAGCEDGAVLALDPTLAAPPRLLTRHAGPVVGLAWCQERLVSASPADGLVAHAAGERPAATLPLAGIAALSASGPWVVVGTRAGEVHAWSPSDGARRGPFLPHRSGAICAVACDSDGARVVCASRRHGLDVIALPEGQSEQLHLLLFGGAVLRFRPDGGALSLGGLQGPGGGEHLWTLARIPGGGLRMEGQADTDSLRTWSADGSTSLVAGDELRVLRQGRPPLSLPIPVARLQNLFLSPDGGRAWVSLEDGALRAWDARTGAELPRAAGPSPRAPRAATSTDGASIAALDPAGPSLVLLDSASGATLARWAAPGQVGALAVYPGGLGVIAAVGPQPLLLPVEGDPQPRPLPAASADVTALAFSHDSRLLALATAAGDVELWHLQRIPQRLKILGGMQAAPTALAFSPDAGLLVAASDEGESLVWDLTATPAVMTQPLPAHANALTLDPTAPRLFAGLGTGHVTLMDWERGEGYTIAPGPPPSPVFRLRAAPDGAALAAVYLEGPTRVWRVPRGGTPEEVAELPPAWDVAWSDRGELYVLAKAGQVLRWSAGAGPTPVLPARPGALGRGLAWGPGERLLVGERGAILFAPAGGGPPTTCPLGRELTPDFLLALPDGAALAGASDRFVAAREGETHGEEEDRFELRRQNPDGSSRVLASGPGRVRALEASRDGHRAAVAVSGAAQLWDLQRGRKLLHLALRPDPPTLSMELERAGATLPSGLDAPVQPVALSAAGDMLACGWPARRVRVWFLDELGVLDPAEQVAARVERMAHFRTQGVEVEAVDEVLDDPRWRRPGR